MHMFFKNWRSSQPSLTTLAVLCLILGFQNCSSPNHFSGGLKSSGNGDGYGGMVHRFYYYDPITPCRQTDLAGHPLPNSAVFGDDSFHLVRSDCHDIPAQPLSSNEYQIDPANGSLAYQNQKYSPDLSAGLRVAESACPTGHNVIAGSTRTNLFADSQELLSSAWYRHPGLTPALSGSALGIPLYSLSRTDPAQLDKWRRLSQFPNILINRSYAISFLAQAGSTSSVYVMLYQTNGLDLQVSLDLATSASTIVGQAGVTGVQVTTQSVDAATSLVTVFFTPTVDPASPDLGVTPTDTAANASIRVTDVRLVDTANYCTP
jgi:hypothetical protein